MMQKIQNALVKYWGYENFLPLQKEAMQCISLGKDSIVILPTGGGKSLCFQAPALTMPGLAVVVSPLISLMKDQVDALAQCGVSASRIDSSMSPAQRENVFARINDKSLKLLYLSPERLLSDGFVNLLKKSNLSFIAIDEAHCVSMWGHDFRPEYRRLGSLKHTFPNITIAAFTATATEHVCQDIALQLRLKNPEMLIGSFDRPNLIYKVQPRKKILKQVCEVLDRHKNESGIIYCIRRKDVDSLCDQLGEKGYKVAPYHAGMTDEDRKSNQEKFVNEHIDTIVATVAFGMGIDKSNVRYVIHTGMPKSLEHYQQESGRAGRDGLEAQCCLFYSGSDYGIWKSLMRDMPEDARKIAIVKLNQMYNYSTGGICRHKAILRYFGQDLGKPNCQACDICLGELDSIDDSLITAQKILSCIARLDQRFGPSYTALVLTGSEDKRILAKGHDKLSTYGLLSDFSKHTVHDWIEQLIGQDYIVKAGEYNVLNITEKGWRLLKGKEKPRLLEPAQRPAKESHVVTHSWEGVDKGLFEALRKLRKTIADKKTVPAYIIFGDAVLRNLARIRPSTIENFRLVKGIGQAKCKQYGETFIQAVKEHCIANSLKMDIKTTSETDIPKPQAPSKVSESRQLAFKLFSENHSINEVAKSVNRAQSTTTQYLVEYIKRENIKTPHPWVDKKTFTCITNAAEKVGKDKYKPIFEYLKGRIDYTQIRITLACLRNK